MSGIKLLFSDIRFWIVLFFVLRLFGITDPPLEVAHNWRQTTVTMAARNFAETDNNILYPRIDIAGEKTGITAMEFPVLNYLIYLASLVFGYAHWYGRLINLIISSIGILFFYKILKKYFSESLAFNSSFILILSVWFTYSRKVMPDTFSMSFIFMAFYYGSNYLDKKQNLKNLLLYLFFALLGVLSKLPSAYILILFFPFILDKKISVKTKFFFVLVSGVVVSGLALYYFVWTPHLTEQFGFTHFFMGKPVMDGFMEICQHLDEAFEKFYEEALEYLGFLLYLAGIFFIIKTKNRTLLYVFSLASLGFLVIMFKAGFAFYHHSYYIIPFAPIMALVAAFTLEQIKNKKIVIALLSLVLIEAILNKNHDFYIKENHMAIMELEGRLDALGDKNDLILINSNNVPTPMYFAHRKGWVEFNEKVADQNFISEIKEKGLKYIVILKRAFGTEIHLDYKKVFEDENFCIYKP